nr:hypothetical protein [Tanacetum cinerariifolium]
MRSMIHFYQEDLKNQLINQTLESCESVNINDDDGSDSENLIRCINSVNMLILPNSNRSRGSRKDNLHLFLWDFHLPTNAIWIMQCSCYLSKIHDGNLPRHGGRLYRSIHGRLLENLAADHLSRLKNPDLGTFTEEEITDEFPDEHLMILKAELNNDEPWGHQSASITGRKVYESGFYWPSIFKDAKDYGSWNWDHGIG